MADPETPKNLEILETPTNSDTGTRTDALVVALPAPTTSYKDLVAAAMANYNTTGPATSAFSSPELVSVNHPHSPASKGFPYGTVLALIGTGAVMGFLFMYINALEEGNLQSDLMANLGLMGLVMWLVGMTLGIQRHLNHMEASTLSVPVRFRSVHDDFTGSLAQIRASDPPAEVILGLEERVGFVDELLVEADRLVTTDAADSPQMDALTDRMVALASEAHALNVLARRRHHAIAAASLETESLLARAPESLDVVGERMADDIAFIDETLNP